jgi:hypothetical protein
MQRLYPIKNQLHKLQRRHTPNSKSKWTKRRTPTRNRHRTKKTNRNSKTIPAKNRKPKLSYCFFNFTQNIHTNRHQHIISIV